MTSVAILGCGYVGTELCRQLVGRGHEVIGVRRAVDALGAIEASGATAVRGDVTDARTLANVPDVDALVFAASSGGRDAAAARRVYVDGLEESISHFGERSRPPERLVYTSSTGVYGDHDGQWVDETTPIAPATAKTEVLARAERVARNVPPEYGCSGIVARVSGIYGPDRYRLQRYLEGPVIEGYRNSMHRDDVAGAIVHLLTGDGGGHQLFLLTDDEPVDRWAFADWLADQVGVEPPPKQTVEQRLAASNLSARSRRRLLTAKRCSNARLRAVGYELRYPTVREGYREAIVAYQASA